MAQLRPPGQNQSVRVRLVRYWDCYIPMVEIRNGVAFIAVDSAVMPDSWVVIVFLTGCTYLTCVGILL